MDQTWGLSLLCNWNSHTSTASSWARSHCPVHEFTSYTGSASATLTYDVMGNLTHRPASLASPALNVEWDFDNRLKGADINGTPASLEVNYEFDALGRRVARRDTSDDIVYVHAGQQVIVDYERGASASVPTYRYVDGTYIDEPILRHTGTASKLPTTGATTRCTIIATSNTAWWR